MDDKTLGQKKQSFVKWLMRRGVSLERAKLICYRKFYHEIKRQEEYDRIDALHKEFS